MFQNTSTSKKELNSFNFDFVLDVAQAPVLVEDIEGNILNVSQSFFDFFSINTLTKQVLGYPSKNIFQIISILFGRESEVFCSMIKNITNKQEVVLNKEFKPLNRSPFLLSFYPIYKANTHQGFIWKVEELIKPRKNFNLLSNTKFSLEKALDYLQNPIAIFDQNLQFVYCNKAYISNDDKRNWAIGKTLTQYYSYLNAPSTEAEIRQQKISDSFQNKQAYRWIETNKDETEFIERICYPVLNELNEVDCVIETAVNISVQKKLESSLRTSIAQFYFILNNIKDLVIETNNNLEIEFANESVRKLFGLEHKNINGKSIFEILDITEYNLYKNVFTLLNKEAEIEEGNLTVHNDTKNLNLFKYKIFNSFDPLKNDPKIVLTLTDITSQRLQEEQLIELIRKEKELNELKSTFVNMVSHELRTPLTVISSSAEILELMLKSGKGYEDVNVYTQQIIDEVEKMTAFMQDLLMISKIEAGKVSINLNETNIVLFVNKIINNHYNPWKDGRYANLIVKGLEQFAKIDEKLLEHALQNILNNAFKYSANKTSPTLRLRFSKKYFTISVIDNGIGIPLEEKQKLFTSFYRATNTGNISGTGIGLMVAKYFTEQHNGYVMFKSKPNIGSIFSLHLPY